MKLDTRNRKLGLALALLATAASLSAPVANNRTRLQARDAEPNRNPQPRKFTDRRIAEAQAKRDRKNAKRAAQRRP